MSLHPIDLPRLPQWQVIASSADHVEASSEPLIFVVAQYHRKKVEMGIKVLTFLIFSILFSHFLQNFRPFKTVLCSSLIANGPYHISYIPLRPSSNFHRLSKSPEPCCRMLLLNITWDMVLSHYLINYCLLFFYSFYDFSTIWDLLFCIKALELTL